MKIRDIGEFGLIKEVAKIVGGNNKRVVVGIGDDAAIVETSPKQLTVLTTDMLVENIHFCLDSITPFQLGYKSLAVNISDMAAMAAIPRFALISLGISSDFELSFVKDLYTGMLELANACDVSIVGGDTTCSEKLIINITLTGEVERNMFRLRSDACLEDKILVTGKLGASSLGLHLILNKWAKNWENLVKAHFMPVPRINEARIASQSGARAMEDISDGLISEITHICEESKVGSRIYLNQLPIADDVLKACTELKLDPYDFALYRGEDYEIVFTAPGERIDEIKRNILSETKTPVTEIGEITGQELGVSLVLPDGTCVNPEKTGYEHFKR